MAFLTVVTHQPLFLFVGAHPPNSADSWAEGMQGPNARWFLIQHYETPLRFLGVETMKKVTFFHPKHWGVLDICHISCPYVSHLKGFKRITFFGLTCFFTNHLLVMNIQRGHFIHSVSWSKDPKRFRALKIQPGFFFGGEDEWTHLDTIFFNWVSSTFNHLDTGEEMDGNPWYLPTQSPRFHAVNFHDWEETPP